MNQSEPNLSVDLNSLIQLLKLRQQNHLNLVQYIKKVSANTDEDTFLDQQLKQHRRFMQAIQTKQHSVDHNFVKLDEKLKQYNRKLIDSEGEKLINKSVLRILQIFQYGVERIIICQQVYEYEYKCFKQSFLKLQNQKNSVARLGQKVMDFSKEKFQKDKMLLQRMIQMIQNGEKDTLPNIIQEKFIQTKNKIQQQRNRMKKIKQDEIKLMKERQREEQEEKIRIHQKMRLFQEGQKIIAKSRKRVTKFSDCILSKLFQPMAEFARAQFTEDMLFADQNQQKAKLLKQLKQRNKLVQSQIFKFIQYSNHMQSKIKVISPKLQKHSNSLPIKSNNIQRISSYKSHSPVPTKMSNNYSSIQTITEFPFINDNKSSKTNNKMILDEHFSPRQNRPKKPTIFVNNASPSQKLAVQNYQLSTQSKSVFDTVKLLSDKKKETIINQVLPHINLSERISLDMGRTKVVVYSRSNPKVLQFNQKMKKRIDAAQMLMPFIPLNIPNKYCVRINKQTSEPIYNLKRLLKN